MSSLATTISALTLRLPSVLITYHPTYLHSPVLVLSTCERKGCALSPGRAHPLLLLSAATRQSRIGQVGPQLYGTAAIASTLERSANHQI